MIERERADQEIERARTIANATINHSRKRERMREREQASDCARETLTARITKWR